MEIVGTFVTMSAAFAVIVAAWIAGKITHYVKVVEFRQAWMIDLRNDIAKFMGAAGLWNRQYEEFNSMELDSQKSTHERQVFSTSTEAFIMLWRIKIRLNPGQRTHDEFYHSLLNLVDPGKIGPQGKPSWEDLANQALKVSQKMLKEEWEMAKRSPRFFGKF